MDRLVIRPIRVILFEQSEFPLAISPLLHLRERKHSMLRFTACLTFALIPWASAQAVVVTQWNFNSATPDASTTTGTSSPSQGAGTALLTGGTSATFATGSATDPAATDNTGWNLAAFPAAASGDLTAGARFNVSTVGFQDITLTFNLRHSNTASRYGAIQYSIDGTNFTTHSFFTASAQDTYLARTADLSAIAGAENNPSFSFRVVSAFENTATGSGTSAYLATRTTPITTYSSNGTWRFDMVTLNAVAVAVPEASSFLFAGLIAGVFGLGYVGRRAVATRA